jgi:hypothetical protein
MATPLRTEPKATERSDAPKATPKGTIAFDSTMVGQTIATGPGTVTGLTLVKPGSVTPVFDDFGNPLDGLLKLPGVLSIYANDMGGGACAKAMHVPFSGNLVLAACPSGSQWQITTA